MKKILALLCGLAFASGAWAFTYDFELSVLNATDEWVKMTPESTIYLIQGDTVLAYYSIGDYYRLKGMAQPSWDGKREVGTTEIKGVEYKVAGATLNSQTLIHDDREGDTKSTGFNIGFTMNDASVDPLQKYDKMSVGPGQWMVTGMSDDLYMLMVGKVLDANDNVVYTADQKLSIYYASFNGTSYKANISFTVNVPEPTSGLLLLLGVAGLALRRKRAA